MVAAFPKIFLYPYHLLMYLKSIFVAGISWKITQVKRMPTWLTFVRSEEDDPLGLLPSTLSLHDHLLWGLSSHLLLLRRIPISKWGLRSNTKVQAFAPTLYNLWSDATNSQIRWQINSQTFFFLKRVSNYGVLFWQ